MKRIFICLLALLSAGNVYAFDRDMIDIHGFVSQGYLISTEHDFWLADTEDGTFQFNEIGLNVTAEPVDNLRVGVQLLSRDLGEAGNNEVKIDWAYGDYYFREWLGIRAGIMKRPTGFYNQIRDIDAARSGIFLPSGVYPEIFRDWYMRTQGVGIYGTLPGNLSYEIQYGTFDVDADGAVAKFLGNSLGIRVTDVRTDSVTAFRLRWDTPLPELAFGVSGFSLGDVEMAAGAQRLNITRHEGYIASVEYRGETCTFSAEYYQTFNSMDLNDIIVLQDDTEGEGWYASGAYRFTDWFELGLGYSVYYPDIDDRDGEVYVPIGQPQARAWLKDLFLSTRFDINEYWIFKLEGHYMNGLYGVTGDMDNDSSEDWFLFAAKTTFSF